MPEQALSDRAVYSAVPVLEVDGEESDRLRELLLDLTITSGEGGLTSAELRFVNVASLEDGTAELAFEDENLLSLGSRLTISLGPADDTTEVFEGVVSGLEGVFSQGEPPTLQVYAEDALFEARLARRTEVHTDVTLSDLLTSLASRIGLQTDIDGLTANLGTQVQLDESDLAFVRRLAVLQDADLQVVDGKIVASTRADRDGDTVTLALGSQLRGVRVFADLSHQATSVSAAGWDVSQGSAVSHTANDRRPGPGSGRTGAELLQDAFGTRREHVAHIPVSTQDEAQALAEAAADQRARRFVVAEGSAVGNPAVRVGARLRLEGLGGRFTNTYDVVQVVHRFDLVGGYITDFRAECAFLEGP